MTAENARISADLSHPDACAKENRDTQAVPPQSLERVRQALLAQPPAMTGGFSLAVWLRWTRAKRRRAEEWRADIPVRHRLMIRRQLPDYSGRHWPTIKSTAQTVRSMKLAPSMRIDGAFLFSKL